MLFDIGKTRICGKFAALLGADNKTAHKPNGLWAEKM
jgi:hypothetical protein